MKMLLHATVRLIVAGLISVAPTLVTGAPLTPSNLIVTVNTFTGTEGAPRYIAEYTPAGGFVQIVATIPAAENQAQPVNQRSGDLVVGPDNAIHVVNGSEPNSLARFDLGSQSWSSQQVEGWQLQRGIATFGQYIYVPDRSVSTDLTSGFIRFDTEGGSPVRVNYAGGSGDVYVGPDGILYTLGSSVRKYDPITLDPLGTLFGRLTATAMAVAGDGSLYIANGGALSHWSSTGQLLGMLEAAPSVTFTDVDISPTGQIALGTTILGKVLLTDLALSGFTSFDAFFNLPGQEVYGADLFVSWVPAVVVPAPPAALLFGSALLGVGILRRRASL